MSNFIGAVDPMKIISVTPPDRGSISVVYGCSECGYEMAMLTNAFETQMVSSLGVRVGPAAPGDAEAPAAAASKCPFSAMVAGSPAEPVASDGRARWTVEAADRMDSVPAFVRPMAKAGIERFAEENGHLVIDLTVLDLAKARLGM
jgi:hypothetical protein